MSFSAYPAISFIPAAEQAAVGTAEGDMDTVRRVDMAFMKAPETPSDCRSASCMRDSHTNLKIAFPLSLCFMKCYKIVN
jgi:hypothetical protein